MPHFYFHVSNENGFVEDEEGLIMESVQSAREQALKEARSMMADDLQQGEIDLTSFIEVEDENHILLFTTHFREAVILKHRDN